MSDFLKAIEPLLISVATSLATIFLHGKIKKRRAAVKVRCPLCKGTGIKP